MKTSQRVPKAIVVVLVVGYGVLHNMENKQLITKPLAELSSRFEKSEAGKDSIQTHENELLTYTRSVISTTIQRFISNL
jgi:hypothetical protein